jgi:exopolyphosphatase/guanosine-5'-triphosphate,3'-diphosphate pyrophosphatase
VASTTKRLGCIDIGSNTTRLLVADRDDGRLNWVHQERAFTRIGESLLVAGQLGPEKIAEVVAVVGEQLACAREHGVSDVRLVATAAIRHAANGRALTDAVRAATGHVVEVLSDAEEARLAFVGVAGTIETPPAGPLAVVDVGGGSSELVVGECPDRISWWVSLPLGSAVLSGVGTTACADPPTPEQLERSRARIAAELTGLAVPRPAVAVAAGGSATSLGRLVGPLLDTATLRRALEFLTSAPAAEVAARCGIDPARARLLPTGLLILEAAAAAFGVPLRVGRGGIREGVLLEA